MASQKDFKVKNGLDVGSNAVISGTLKVGNTTVSSIIDSAGVISLVSGNSLDSSGVISLVDSSYVQSRQITYDFLDSAEAINLIDSAYIQTRQLTYDFLDSAEANNLINSALTNYRTVTQIQTMIDSDVAALVDAAPGALDTLNELAAALGDDANFSTTITNQIAALPDSAQVATIVTSYGYTTYDSGNTLGLIDSAYIQSREAGDASRGFAIAMSIAL
jgi:hypothetical protein